MQCICGEINSSNAKFCKVCGASVQKESIVKQRKISCPNCKESQIPNKKFCTKCGCKLIEKSSETQPALVGNVEQQSLDSESAQDKQSANIESRRIDSPVGINNRKTIIMIGILLVTIIVTSILYWYFKNTENQLPATDELSTVNSDATDNSAEENSMSANMEIQTVSDDVLKSYIGRTVKIGDSLGDYFVGSEMKDTKFKLLVAANDNEDEILLVTSFSGKVIDAIHYNYPKNIFIDSKSACLKEGIPFNGAFVATNTGKLTPPSKIWKISEDGKLVDETVEGLMCAVVFECMPESDVCFNIGFNDKIKETVVINNNANQGNTQTKAPKNKKLKDQPLPAKSKKDIGKKDTTSSNTVPESEVYGSQKPHSESKEESQGIGGFFEKLGESVQKGATVPPCSDAQKALNQCN